MSPFFFSPCADTRFLVYLVWGGGPILKAAYEQKGEKSRADRDKLLSLIWCWGHKPLFSPLPQS